MTEGVSQPCSSSDLGTKLEGQIFEEWKVIQAKIDKIGEFRFNVKNWSMTATVAYLAGLYVTKAPWQFAAFAVLTPVVFWIVEYRQELLQNILSERAEYLESALKRIAVDNYDIEQTKFRKRLLGASKLAPGLATSISTFTRSNSYRRAKWWESKTFYTSEVLLVIGACLVLNSQTKKNQHENSSAKASAQYIKAIIDSNAKLDADIQKLIILKTSEQSGTNSIALELRAIQLSLLKNKALYSSDKLTPGKVGVSSPISLSEQAPYQMKLSDSL